MQYFPPVQMSPALSKFFSLNCECDCDHTLNVTRPSKYHSHHKEICGEKVIISSVNEINRAAPSMFLLGLFIIYSFKYICGNNFKKLIPSPSLISKFFLHIFMAF